MLSPRLSENAREDTCPGRLSALPTECRISAHPGGLRGVAGSARRLYRFVSGASRGVLLGAARRMLEAVVRADAGVDPNASEVRVSWEYVDYLSRGRSGRHSSESLAAVRARICRYLRRTEDALAAGEATELDTAVRAQEFTPSSLALALALWSDDLWVRLGERIMRGADRAQAGLDAALTREEWLALQVPVAAPRVTPADDDSDPNPAARSSDLPAAVADLPGPGIADGATASRLGEWLLHLADCVLRKVPTRMLGRDPYCVYQDTLRRKERRPFGRRAAPPHLLLGTQSVDFAQQRADRHRDRRGRAGHAGQLGVPVWVEPATLTVGLVAAAKRPFVRTSPKWFPAPSCRKAAGPRDISCTYSNRQQAPDNSRVWPTHRSDARSARVQARRERYRGRLKWTSTTFPGFRRASHGRSHPRVGRGTVRCGCSPPGFRGRLVRRGGPVRLSALRRTLCLSHRNG